MSKLFGLERADFVKGMAIAVFSAVVTTLNEAVQAGSFDLFSYDWAFVGKVVLSTSVSYLLKNFLTSSNGKILGRIG